MDKHGYISRKHGENGVGQRCGVAAYVGHTGAVKIDELWSIRYNELNRNGLNECIRKNGANTIS